MTETAVHVCPECGEEFSGGAAALRLGGHRKREHGVPGKGKEASRASSSSGGAVSSLRQQLKDAAMMMAVGTLMASGNATAMTNPLVADALEARADKFADAWWQIARQDQRVYKAIQQLLTGGIWVNAVGQTLAFGMLVITFAGKPVVPAGALYFFPELKPFLQAPPPGWSPNGAPVPEPEPEFVPPEPE